MPPVGFEPTISAGERPQTYALERAATATGIGPFEKGGGIIFLSNASFFPREHFLVEDSQDSPFRPSGKSNMLMKMNLGLL
jgi:hypothetical protein